MPPVPKKTRVGVQDVQLPPTFTGIRVRLYYPTSTPYSYFKRHSRFPRDGPPFHLPTVSSRGAVKFANLPSIAGLFLHLAPKISALNSGIVQENNREPLRVVLFSHGAFALTSVYCELCMEIARGGFLVAALEHGDRSGLGTVVLREELRKEAIYFEKRGRSLQGDVNWRQRQMEQRIKEMVAVVEYLREVNNGERSLETTRGKKGVDLRGLLNIDKVHVCGHSFGGASCLGFAIDRPEWCDKIVLTDPWLKSVGKERLMKGVGANTELLLIKDEISKTGASERIAKRVSGENFNAEKIILMEAGHHIQTDVAHMLPRFIGKRIKLVKSDAKHKPAALNRTNNVICREFISSNWAQFKMNKLTDSGEFASHVRLTTL